ncbi:MAG TPA: hypothetical protein VEW69_12915 [Alphaproteobacteria bacterium]|nr:hypothetical protein [Alphaproteobacteria bacterium]
MKLAGLLMMVLAIASPMLASAVAAPEIDAGSATAAIALLSGSLLVLKARKKK